jgi:hypothetical protein
VYVDPRLVAMQLLHQLLVDGTRLSQWRSPVAGVAHLSRQLKEVHLQRQLGYRDLEP